ncbi:uncharacterized protein ALTATR162_LOCUS5829 [Alternaria atra]|uniref:Uncharacterized protein n=1 Tax=Alternaria atra TaxID=119953 RepID=A0A8J2I1I9_9PLEO|nr:uncharacterized protein ALTATR162_LOCUS5829 [Alternaria atra]CAG5160481.1 unnamed protein product [Alternaria atra]
MPIKEHLKAVVFTAAAKAEAIIDTYPTHFYDIEEAKGYIRTTCKQAGFQYVSKRIKHEELAYVKDMVCFIVAAKAFEQGEFYLEIELENRRALRTSLDSGKSKVNGEEDVDVKSHGMDETAVESTEIKERNEVSMLAYDMPSTGSAMTPTGIPVFSAATDFSNAIDSINIAITTTNALETTTTGGTMSASMSDEPSQCERSVKEIAQGITMPPMVEIDDDPFKVSFSSSQK